DVENVVLVNVNAARTAELLPLCNKFAVLVEDLNPVVVAIADKQASLRVHRHRVRLIELARTGAQLAPGLNQLAGFRKFEDAVISGAVSLRYEDDAVGRNQNIIRLVEIVGLGRASRFTERHQKLSFGTEFVDLIPLRCSRTGTNRTGTTRSFASRTFTTR